MLLRSLLLCALLALNGASSEDNALEDDVDRTTSTLSSIQLPGELSLSNNFLNGVATAGAVVLGVLGVAAVLAILLPLFGIKMCYLTGTCDPMTPSIFVPSQPLPASVAGAPHAYDAYSTGYNAPAQGYSSTSYQRRSLEYVGPILRALSAAYDKYAAPRLLRKGGRASGRGPVPAPAAAPATEGDAPPAAARRR